MNGKGRCVKSDRFMEKSLINGQHKEKFKRVAGQLLIDLGYEQDFDW